MIPQFELDQIRCGYLGGFTLDVQGLAIQPRRMNVLTGSNGCGKSTLLHVLAFLREPISGTLSFSGRRVQWNHHELRSLRRQVTLVEQNPYLFRGNVANNVEYGLKLRGVRGDAAHEAVMNALALVSLGRFHDRDVRQLSGGECRRVAIARALALNPEVLLLDEPLANLDAQSTAVVERVIAALPELGTTVVMSTHDRTVLDRFDCDIIRLLDGRVDYARKVDVCRPFMMPAL